MIRPLGAILASALIFAIASQGLYAQNESLDDLLGDTVNSDEQPKIELEPNPLDLQSNWWNYFEDSGVLPYHKAWQ